MLIFGPLSDVVNLNTLLVLSGVVMIILGLPFFVNKTMREAGIKIKSPLPSMAAANVVESNST
jgi:hypothetical protein